LQIGIVLADDHPIFRRGVRSLLEKEGFSVLGEGSDGFEAIKLIEKYQPDVLVIDLSMPRLNGLAASKEIQGLSTRTKIILITVHREEQYVAEAIRAGVKGYVLKSEAAEQLPAAIREVHRGHAYFSPAIARFAVDSALKNCTNGEPTEVLSPRELRVLQLIAEGNTTREIAGHLNLTVKTTESYRTGLMTKLDIHETATLVRYAVRRGLVKP
jgi:DNA-binding NarL/FixJ family response regulator